MVIDMHTHTCFSDGAYLPEEVISIAKKNNVSILGITDHDTLCGIQHLYENCKIVPSDMEIIPGIEITGKVSKGTMHILGYGLDVSNKRMNEAMKIQKQKRIEALTAVYKYVEERNSNIRFSDKDIKQIIASKRSIGRPDLAKLLIKYGKVKTINEAFSKYLNEAHEATRKEFGKGLPYKECLELILNSGGIPVLAHPKTLKLDELEFLKLLKEMINCGLRGLEVYHSIHTSNDINYYLEIANKYNLLISGGSDFHGKAIKPSIQLGITGKDKKIVLNNLSIVDELHDGPYKILKR